MRGLAASSLCLGIIAGILTLLRAVQLEEALTPRALGVAGLACLAALSFGGLLWLFLGWFGRNWPRPARGLAAAILMTGGFLAAFAMCFAVYDRLIAGNFDETESDEMAIASMLFWSHAGGVGQFALTGLRYALPLPAPLIGAAAFALFYFWPRRSAL